MVVEEKYIKEALNIFESIGATTSRTEKENLLSSAKHNKILRMLLVSTYDPFTIYGIKKDPKVMQMNVQNKVDNFNEFCQILGWLSTRTITGNEALNIVSNFFAGCTEHEYKWYLRVLQKDLKIGITDKTINKVMKGLIPTFSCALAHPLKKFPKNFIMEPKLDGYRCLAVHKADGSVELRSRNGHLIEGYNSIEKDISQLPKGYVYDGEIMAPSGKFADVQKSAFRKSGGKEGILHIFDVVPLSEFMTGKSEQTLAYRLCALDVIDEIIDDIPLWSLQIVPHSEALTNTQEGINKAYQMSSQYIADGYEGGMVKDLDKQYVCKKSYNIQKIKEFYDIDLEVVGVYEGKEGTKYEGTLGGVTVELSDKDIIEQLPEKMQKFVPDSTFEVGVGSGFSDELRNMLWNHPNDIIGKTIQITFQEVTFNDKGEHSLRFPTFTCVRTDK